MAKVEIVKLWKEIKKDAEKKRKGSKPGGKMGFEAKITAVDKLLLAKDPNVDLVAKQIAALISEMIKYASDLDDSEKDFVKDIKSFTQMLGEIARGAIASESAEAKAQFGESKEIKALLVKSARIAQVIEKCGGRMTTLQDNLAAARDANNAAEIKDITKLIDKLNDFLVNTVQKEQAAILNTMMQLVD